MKSSNSRPLPAVALTLALAVASLHAAPRALAEPSAADKVSAKDFMREGKELRAKGDHAGALKKFGAAYAVVPTPITGLAVAKEQIALGLLVEGRDTLGEVQRMPVKATESPEGKAARDEAASLLSDITPRIPVVEIRIGGAPPSNAVTLTVDGHGVPLVAAEEGWRVNPGPHAIVATTAGLPDQKVSIELAEGERKKLDVVFPVGPAKSAEPAHTEEPASVTPPNTTPTVATKTTATTDAAPTGSGHRTLGLALAVGGVVVSGVGGYFAIAGADQFKNPGDDGGICNADCQANQSSGRTKTRLGLAVIGAGAAVAVTGVVLWITAKPDAKPSSGTYVGVTPGGLVLRATF